MYSRRFLFRHWCDKMNLRYFSKGSDPFKRIGPFFIGLPASLPDFLIWILNGELWI